MIEKINVFRANGQTYPTFKEAQIAEMSALIDTVKEITVPEFIVEHSGEVIAILTADPSKESPKPRRKRRSKEEMLAARAEKLLKFQVKSAT